MDIKQEEIAAEWYFLKSSLTKAADAENHVSKGMPKAGNKSITTAQLMIRDVLQKEVLGR